VNAPMRRLATLVWLLFISLFAASTYIQYLRADWLDARPGNARTLYKNYGRERQPIVLANQQIAKSTKVEDSYNYLRTYPEGQLYASITGFYSIVYGATGLESAEDGLLSGTSDQLFYRRITDLLTGKPAQGATVELTVSARAQKAAWDALGSKRGAVVALDPKTGDVLAMVSKPSYDPNQLASHDVDEVRDAYTKLNADKNDPLINRAIAGDLYFPGSTFKVITAAAALESGRYEPDTEVAGPAKLPLPQTKNTLPNDFAGACGANDKVTLANALKMSCNTAFGSVGMDLGQQALADQSAKFGFGQRWQIPLNVTASTFPAQTTPPTLAYAAIGQDNDRVTPLQMAMVAAAIGNDGELMKPNLINRVLSSDLKVLQEPSPDKIGRAVSSGTASKLKTMMEGVVDDGTGTRAQISGIKVAGKTGTAENGDRPPLAWFISFAPADDPQVAVAVVVEDGGDYTSGGRVAAPIAKKVMEAVINP